VFELFQVLEGFMNCIYIVIFPSKVKVKPSLCLTITSWRRMGEWRYSSTHILNLGARWKWVASFTPRPLFIWGKRPRYLLDRRLGESPEPVLTRWRREKFPAPAGNRVPVV